MRRTTRRTAAALALVLAVLILLPQGAARASAEYTLDDSPSFDSGVTTISWTRTGEEEDVKVYIRAIDNGTSEQSLWLIGTTSSTSAVTNKMLPGKRYHVTIADTENYILAETDYELPAPAAFTDGSLKNTSVKVKIEKRSAPYNTRDYETEKTLSAAKMKSDMEAQTAWYGIKYLMQMPRLAKPRSFFVTLAFDSGGGV